MSIVNKRLLVAFVLLLGMAPAGLSYDRKLDAAAIREAYFVGTDSYRAESFLADYQHDLRCGQGVCVKSATVETPFKAVVRRAATAPEGTYSPARAEAEFSGASSFAIEVTLELPLGSLEEDPNFWQAYDIQLVQDDEVKSLTQQGRPLYTYVSGEQQHTTREILRGAVVRVVYDAEDVASSYTRIVVRGPDGVQGEDEFDLGGLR